MRKNRLRSSLSILFLSVLLFVPAPSGAENALRVLFIGNSYTYYHDLPGMVQQLAAALDRKVVVGRSLKGGATLQQHWMELQAIRLLREQSWDYVVLQEQSLRPVENPEQMYEYARRWDAEIKKSGAKTLLYLTWARLNRPEMQAELTEAYSRIARELGAQVVPAGVAWQEARRLRPEIALHDDDGSHPNPTGSYLTACVFIATLFQKNPGGLPARIRAPDGGQDVLNLSREDALFLQRMAWNTVQSTTN